MSTDTSVAQSRVIGSGGPRPPQPRTIGSGGPRPPQPQRVVMRHDLILRTPAASENLVYTPISESLLYPEKTASAAMHPFGNTQAPTIQRAPGTYVPPPTVSRVQRIEFAKQQVELPPGVLFDRRKNDRLFASFENRLSVKNLKKNFGKKKIVKGVGFYINGGDIAGLLGPNGAGKTTIFYMIVGFYRPNEGSVTLNKTNISVGPMYRRARLGIAYLPQEASIFRKLTVEQNIQAVLESRKDLNRKQKKERLDQLIDEFGIGRIRKQAGFTLSGGERRRTEIARALAIEPKFLLLDEPFAGIDPIAVFDIKQIIRKLAAGGIGVLITDHNVRDTLEITNDAFIISDGLIVARGTREMILNNQLVRDIYLGQDFQM